jgi:hypothetical protein
VISEGAADLESAVFPGVIVCSALSSASFALKVSEIDATGSVYRVDR